MIRSILISMSLSLVGFSASSLPVITIPPWEERLPKVIQVSQVAEQDKTYSMMCGEEYKNPGTVVLNQGNLVRLTIGMLELKPSNDNKIYQFNSESDNQLRFFLAQFLESSFDSLSPNFEIEDFVNLAIYPFPNDKIAILLMDPRPGGDLKWETVGCELSENSKSLIQDLTKPEADILLK